MGWDAPWHWIVLAVAAIALFGGYKKLPDAARAIGRSLRIFKTEIKGLTEDDKARDGAAAQPAEPRALPPAEMVPPANPAAPPAAAQAAGRPRPRPAPAAGQRGPDAR